MVWIGVEKYIGFFIKVISRVAFLLNVIFRTVLDLLLSDRLVSGFGIVLLLINTFWWFPYQSMIQKF